MILKNNYFRIMFPLDANTTNEDVEESENRNESNNQEEEEEVENGEEHNEVDI